MPIILPFKQVDVFTSELYKGNPVAVTNCMGIDESQVTTEQLQAVAVWTNLSETTFIFKPTEPGCDYKLRIFTPANELPFAGHPTVGSCKAFMEFTGVQKSKLVQQCGVGNIELTITPDNKISFMSDKTAIEDIDAELAGNYEKVSDVKFNTTPKLLRVGPNWIVGLVEDSEAVLSANPDFVNMCLLNKANRHTGIIVGGIKKGSTTGNEYEIRAFAPAIDVDEDPVCGSGTLAFIRYLQELNQYAGTKTFKVTQGARVGRAGNLDCKIEVLPNGNVHYHVGGSANSIVNGTITI